MGEVTVFRGQIREWRRARMVLSVSKLCWTRTRLKIATSRKITMNNIITVVEK